MYRSVLNCTVWIFCIKILIYQKYGTHMYTPYTRVPKMHDKNTSTFFSSGHIWTHSTLKDTDLWVSLSPALEGSWKRENLCIFTI